MGSKSAFWDDEIGDWDRSRYSGRGPIEARHQLALEQITRVLQSGSGETQVIELGCGSARMAAPILRAGAKTYLGYDFSPSAVSLARERLNALGIADRARVELMDLTEVRQIEADLIFSLGFLDWISDEDLPSVLRQIRSPCQLHSFSEKRRGSVQQWLHKIYSHFHYERRLKGYRPSYRPFEVVKTLLNAPGNSESSWKVLRDSRMAFGSFIHNFDSSNPNP